MKYADLHTHTIFSDGTTHPEEIVRAAKEADLSAIAICDHDTVDGILPAKNAAQELDLEIVPSLELSAERDNLEVHILGFLIEYRNSSLIESLKEMRQARIDRMRDMVDKLKTLNVNIDVNDVFKLAGEATVGRLHLARVLKDKGYIVTLNEAFYKYIGENCPAYVARFKLSPKEAIGLILQSGGVPVLAHPHTLGNDSLIEEFAGYGMCGIETYYPEYQDSRIQHYEDIADKLNLVKTGGSDYHGDIKPQNPLGKVKVAYSVVQALRDVKAKINS